MLRSNRKSKSLERESFLDSSLYYCLLTCVYFPFSLLIKAVENQEYTLYSSLVYQSTILIIIIIKVLSKATLLSLKEWEEVGSRKESFALQPRE